MLGAVAILYFFATALAMAVACAGPDTRAKFCSAYLMCAWGLTNRIFITTSPEDALAQFSTYDVLAIMGILIVYLCWPRRWTALLLAALTTQVAFQIYQRLHPGGIGPAFAVNEAMYVVQLVAVTIPTIAQARRRRRAKLDRLKRRPTDKIPPPYKGWHPPDEVLGPLPREPWQDDPPEPGQQLSGH